LADRLDFRASNPLDRAPLAGTTRLVTALLVFAAVAAAVRLVARPAVPDGVPIEVRGDVPRPGYHLLVDPTVHAAIRAAGGAPTGADGPLRPGDRVDVRPDGVRVLPPSDPVLVGVPIDPNAADATAFAAVPGVGKVAGEALVAWRDANGPFVTLGDLRRVPDLPPDTVDRLAPFLALPDHWSSRRTDPEGPVDLNHAGAAELESLPGIGAVLAARIVVDRADRGPFATVDDLARVEGVGPALVDRVRDRVVAGPP
jgi:competence protein ComEA